MKNGKAYNNLIENHLLIKYGDQVLTDDEKKVSNLEGALAAGIFHVQISSNYG